METTLPKFSFPHIESVRLEDFTLYSSEPVISEKFGAGVFCLAGANGLGKSTFLANVNFGLTGCVPDPQKEFKSFAEHFDESLRFAKDYFSGRIGEDDRESAEIKIIFRAGTHQFEVARGFFELNSIRSLRVTKGEEVVYDGDDATGEERNKKYHELIPGATGLSSFEQFVFLLHYVLTFDERRKLLFWDQRVLERSLYLCFGGDANDATRADALRREADKADSLARNEKWSATKLQERIKDLKQANSQGAKKAAEAKDLEDEHKKLQSVLDSAESDVSKAGSRLRDAQLKVHEASAEIAALNQKYESEFARISETTAALSVHPVVRQSIATSCCGLCGTSGKAVADKVRENTSGKTCPLCSQTLSTAKKLDVSKLKEIDAKIAVGRKKLNEAEKATARLSVELTKIEDGREAAGKAMSSFERANEEFLRQAKAPNGDIDDLIKKFATQAEEHLKRAKDLRAKRDKKVEEIDAIHKKTSKGYRKLETEFVPRFQKLAKLFLGIPLDIQFQANAGGIQLVVDVDNTPRREHHQLSESQRFFLDIALRMALVQQMAGKENSACLFIDTPEGSLDITYESRAGEMFAEFVRGGNQMMMTANINSSQMLLSLAKDATSKFMTVCRMTNWTKLSSVQQEREDMFDTAMERIEKALKTSAN